MPRNLARLKFRPVTRFPPRPLNHDRLLLQSRPKVEHIVKEHVLRASKTNTKLGLSIVVDPRWKRSPAHQRKKLQERPHTLKKLVDRQAARKHGRVIYVFRNIRTGQVIYSLQCLLDQYHLDQLPFMGKHSKPPTIRPDEWTPHCVVTFQTAAQGHDAFRRLREFRKIHEVSWQKTNPEWIKVSKESRMKKIMNQVEFSVTDLAAVLTQQAKRKRRQIGARSKQKMAQNRFMDKKWPEIEVLANAAGSKDKKVGDDPKWLQQQIKRMDYQLGMKTNQDDKDQQRLKTAKLAHETRLKKIMFAQRKYELLKGSVQKLEKQVAPLKDLEVVVAPRFDKKGNQLNPEMLKAKAQRRVAMQKVESLKQELSKLEKAYQLANKHATPRERSHDVMASDLDTIKERKHEIRKFEKALEAQHLLAFKNNPAYQSVLPRILRKDLPEPFTMNVEIKWADLLDAERAQGMWPQAVVHDILPLRAQKEKIQFVSAVEYERLVQQEVVRTVDELEKRFEETQEKLPQGKDEAPWRMLPKVKNIFKRAEA